MDVLTVPLKAAPAVMGGGGGQPSRSQQQDFQQRNVTHPRGFRQKCLLTCHWLSEAVGAKQTQTPCWNLYNKLRCISLCSVSRQGLTPTSLAVGGGRANGHTLNGVQGSEVPVSKSMRFLNFLFLLSPVR